MGIAVKPFAKQSGIYRIYRLNGSYRECWVGQAKDFYRRWQSHIHHFRNDTNSPILQRAWEKYGGVDGFGWEALEFVPVERLNAREQYYLDTIRPIYNIAKVAESPHLGVTHSDIAKAHLRAAWERRRQNGHSPQRLAAYEQARGQYNEKLASATAKSQALFAQQRAARTQAVLDWIVAQGWDALQLPLGSIQLAQRLSEALDMTPSAAHHLLRHMKAAGIVTWRRRGPVLVSRKGQTSPNKARAAQENLQKAHAVNRATRAVTGYYPHPPAQWTAKRRAAQERSKAQGPTPAQLAYWARMRTQKCPTPMQGTLFSETSIPPTSETAS